MCALCIAYRAVSIIAIRCGFCRGFVSLSREGFAARSADTRVNYAIIYATFTDDIIMIAD